jgi:hypothetical protein
MKTYSTLEMIDGLLPLLKEHVMVKGSPLSEFEAGFLLTMKNAKAEGRLTRLSDKQVEILDQLHAKHCRGIND